jgi:hypothetical protein
MASGKTCDGSYTPLANISSRTICAIHAHLREARGEEDTCQGLHECQKRPTTVSKET